MCLSQRPRIGRFPFLIMLPIAGLGHIEDSSICLAQTVRGSEPSFITALLRPSLPAYKLELSGARCSGPHRPLCGERGRRLGAQVELREPPPCLGRPARAAKRGAERSAPLPCAPSLPSRGLLAGPLRRAAGGAQRRGHLRRPGVRREWVVCPSPGVGLK